MTEKITNTQYYQDIADAIREKTESQTNYLPSDMSAAINNLLMKLPEGIKFAKPSSIPGNPGTVDLSIFTTSHITDMSDMFSRMGRYTVTTLDISNFDFSNVETFTNMFGSDESGIRNTATIYVKDQTAKDWINTNFSRLTNVRIKV